LIFVIVLLFFKFEKSNVHFLKQIKNYAADKDLFGGDKRNSYICSPFKRPIKLIKNNIYSNEFST